jgi:nicotinamide-nucleotide amidase
MLEDYVLPHLRSQHSSLFIVQKNFLSVGIPESKIDEMIRPLVDRYKKVSGCRVIHGILASQSIITVKFSVEGKNQEQVAKAASLLSKKFKTRLGSVIFGEDEDTLSRVVGRLLRERKQTVAVAESCTGGLIAKLLTDEPGSSDYFIEAVVTYANKSKQDRLGVKKDSLDRYGAVSEEVAKEMALGLKRRADVDYALSTTGVAGPTGGSVEKPVGLVYIGCSGPKRTVVKKFHFSGDREWIRHRAALMALDLLRKELLA